MRIFLTLIALLIGFCPKSIYARQNTDMCRVTASTWSLVDKVGTGIYELGKFPVTEKGDTTTKTFKFDNYDAGLIVSVGVEYGDFPAVEKGKPIEIRLELTVSDKEQKAFHVPDTAVAGTNYGRRWGRLYVEKQIARGQLIHTFMLDCNDGNNSRKRR